VSLNTFRIFIKFLYTGELDFDDKIYPKDIEFDETFKELFSCSEYFALYNDSLLHNLLFVYSKAKYTLGSPPPYCVEAESASTTSSSSTGNIEVAL